MEVLYLWNFPQAQKSAVKICDITSSLAEANDKTSAQCLYAPMTESNGG